MRATYAFPLGEDRIGTDPHPCPTGQTCYELCIFTSGPRVEAIQQALTKGGADLSKAAPGVFDAETCAAWTKLMGSPPDAQSLIAAGTNPNETCFNAAVPACPGSAGVRSARMTGRQWGMVGAAVGLAFLGGWYLRRRRA